LTDCTHAHLVFLYRPVILLRFGEATEDYVFFFSRLQSMFMFISMYLNATLEHRYETLPSRGY